MKKIIIFSISFLFIIGGYFYFSEGNVLNKSDEFKLTGQVFQTESYCGGAPPQREVYENEDGSQEVFDQEEELATPKPVEGKVLYIKKGETNNLNEDPVETVTTDEEGSFSVNLSSGTYCVVEEQKQSLPSSEEYSPGDMYGVDTQCLEDKWNECDKVVELSTSTTIELTYNKNCYWNKECTFCKQEHAPCPLPQ